MQKELLPPDFILDQLRSRLKKLKEVYEQLQKATEKTIEGHLRIIKNSNSAQYYHRTNPKDYNGKYLPRSENELAEKLAQKDYYIKIIPALENEISATELYLSKISRKEKESKLSGEATKLDSIYKKMTLERQKLVSPLTFTDEQYINQWQKESWQGRPISSDAPYLLTTRKERVRSKSELLIADALARCNIPYRYEFPLELISAAAQAGKNKTEVIKVYPDFLCLNVKKRSEYYWEHFGLMDNKDYAHKASRKLRLYAENNIYIGKNLIITMETQSEPLSTLVIEKTIKEIFL